MSRKYLNLESNATLILVLDAFMSANESLRAWCSRSSCDVVGSELNVTLLRNPKSNDRNEAKQNEISEQNEN